MARTKQVAKTGPQYMKKMAEKRKKVIEGVDEIESPRAKRHRERQPGKEKDNEEAVDPRFKSNNYHKLYNKTFGIRKIAYGRVVDFKSLDENHAPFVRQWFEAQQWDKLLMKREPIYPDLVRQFYTHFDKSNEEEGEIHTWVKGQTIVLDEATLGEILGIPAIGLYDMPGKRWSTVEGFDRLDCIRHVLMEKDAETDTKPEVDQLPMPTRLLHLIVMNTFISREGRKSSLTFLDLLVMYCILAKKRVNMPRMMIGYMTASQKSTKDGSLPYGMWLTKVFRYFKVDLSNEAFTVNNYRPFNKSTISGSIGFKWDESTGFWTKIGIKRAPRREDPAPKFESKGDEVERKNPQVPHGNCSCMFNSLVVQKMLRRLHPDVFTPAEMDEIRESARMEMDIKVDSSDHDNEDSGQFVGDDEEYDEDDDDDAGVSGLAGTP